MPKDSICIELLKNYSSVKQWYFFYINNYDICIIVSFWCPKLKQSAETDQTIDLFSRESLWNGPKYHEIHET